MALVMPAMAETVDSDLVARLREGDRAAVEEAYLAHHVVDVLFSGAYTFIGTPECVCSVMPSKPLGRRFQVKNHVPTSSIVIRRGYAATLEHVFDPDPLMRIEDYHFLLNAYFGGARLRNRPGIDAFYRYHVVSRYPSTFKIFMLIDYPNADDRARFAKLQATGALPKSATIGGAIGIHGGTPPGYADGEAAHDWTLG